jgi:hypothetical protein
VGAHGTRDSTRLVQVPGTSDSTRLMCGCRRGERDERLRDGGEARPAARVVRLLVGEETADGELIRVWSVCVCVTL